MTRRSRPLLCAALCLAAPAALAAPGPGLPNLTYDPAEVYTVIGHLGAENGAPRGHGYASLHQGYLTVIFSQDSGEGWGGFAFYDLSDPRAPRLVHAVDDAQTYPIREAHGFGFSRVNGREVVVLQALTGVQFWDWTDVTAPVLLNELTLPGVELSDYGTGAWWAFWQGSHVYLGGSGNGLYVIDAHDPAAPFLVQRPSGGPNPVPITEIGRFKTGPVFACGEYLYITGMNESGFSVVDIIDPAEPRLVSSVSDFIRVPPVYAGMFNGGMLLGAGVADVATVHDVSDPTRIRELGVIPDIGGKGGYLTFQDGFLHVGASERFTRIDIRTPGAYSIVGFASSEVSGRDEDFATALGNLTVISDDHGKGSFIVPHQAAPDTTPPAVNWVSPADGAIQRSPLVRVGLTFTDSLDFSTVTDATFVLRKADGTVVPGQLSHQTSILNFEPAAPLEPDTTYEVVLPAGGIRDAAGNALAVPYVSRFSTGAALVNTRCRLESDGPSLPGAPVTLTATLSGVTVDAYQFEPGDGSPPSAVLATPSLQHTYAAEGHYTAVVWATGPGGAFASCAFTQTVHRPLAAGRPARSSTVVADAAGERAFVANPDHRSVTVIDLTARARLVEADVEGVPRGLALADDGGLWVAVEEPARLLHVDPVSGVAGGDAELPRGSRPAGVVVAPGTRRAFVTLAGLGQVAEVDLDAQRVTRLVDVGPDPRGLALDAAGARLFVTRFVSPDAAAEVAVLDAATLTVEATRTLALDPGPDREDSGRGLLNYLRSPAPSPDGARVFLAAKKDNIERGVYRDALVLDFESTVRAVVAELDATGVEVPGARRDLNDRSLPSAVEVSPLGDLLFVALEGSSTVDVLDAYDGRLLTSLPTVGEAPDGLALVGTTLLVHGFLSRELTVLDVSGVLDGSTNRALPLGVVPTVEAEVLDAAVLAGKRLFYDASDPRMSRDGYLACAVCHLDGEHDGRTWDFTDRGEGYRNTIDLRGRRGAAQGPLHWTANFDEVQDFENDMRLGFGGKGFLTDADFEATRQTLGEPKAGRSPELDALDAYLASLDRAPPSPFRAADGALTAAAARGRRLFAAAGCDECHGGPDATDSPSGQRHDVGTLRDTSGGRLQGPIDGLDTPTLIGLWATAPYLHDGSAATVEAVLERAAESGRHGAVGALTAAQRGDLARYLLERDGTPEVGGAAPRHVEGGGGCALGSPAGRSGAEPRATPWLAALALLLVAGRRARARLSAGRFRAGPASGGPGAGPLV